MPPRPSSVKPVSPVEKLYLIRRRAIGVPDRDRLVGPPATCRSCRTRGRSSARSSRLRPELRTSTGWRSGCRQGAAARSDRVSSPRFLVRASVHSPLFRSETWTLYFLPHLSPPSVIVVSDLPVISSSRKPTATATAQDEREQSGERESHLFMKRDHEPADDHRGRSLGGQDHGRRSRCPRRCCHRHPTKSSPASSRSPCRRRTRRSGR